MRPRPAPPPDATIRPIPNAPPPSRIHVAAEERGALFEGWLLTVLRAHNDVSPLYEDISYWAPLQTRETEVDLWLRRGREYLAIEIKAQSRFSTTQLSGLRVNRSRGKAIDDLKGIVRRILVHLGDRTLQTADGIETWPLPTFLSAVAKGTLWP